MTYSPNDELYLLKRFGEGDEQAFRQLFDLYKERLYAFVLQLTHSRVEAEEIVQEVFLKLWEMKGRVKEVEHAGKYLYTIARNKTYNHLAKVARNEQHIHQLWLNISIEDRSTELLLAATESQQLINQAVAQLSKQKQTLFRLSREQGLSHQQIAEQLGLSKSRVNNLLGEILKHIKDYLNTHSPILAICFWLETGHLLF